MSNLLYTWNASDERHIPIQQKIFLVASEAAVVALQRPTGVECNAQYVPLHVLSLLTI